MYITHEHPDHHFGVEIIKQRFPEIRVIARPEVVAEMQAHGLADVEAWKPVYKNDLADAPPAVEAYTEDTTPLEGHEIRILGPMQGDTSHEFPVHVPKLGTVILGDMAYNGVHAWLAEPGPVQRKAWIASLKAVEALKVETVVAGDKSPSRGDDPAVLEETRAYIESFEKAVAESGSAADVEQKMLATYGELKLPIILSISSQAAFSAAEP